jgi:HAD superfamily hydrolase (TIGR01549 family)
VDDPATLHRVLEQAEALFLDFDGPVCDLFAGLPASTVVDQLCVVLADGGYGDPPPNIEKSLDPFDVLKYAATLGEAEAQFVNAAFTAHEVEAIATAEPTRDAHNFIRAWSRTSRPMAIISNNSTIAIDAYFELHGLQDYVTYISGRESPDPALLKPNSHLLDKALAVLGTLPASTAFVGDSVTDIEAASSVGTASIGYANKPGKLIRLAFAGASAVVSSNGVLLASLARFND